MEENVKVANKVSVVSIVWNVILSAVKFIVGMISNSAALISDSLHSLSDVLSTFAVIAGVNIAARTADDGHPYGHERMESIFSILLAAVLCAAGVGIGASAVMSIWGGNYKTLESPGAIALGAAALSILVKECMYHYTMHYAKKIRSTALKADAWHHRSDALSSIGSFIGIFLARKGYPICDPIAGVIISVFIIKAAWDIFKEATNQLVDKAADPETNERIKKAAEETEGVICVDMVKTRLFGAKMYADIEIGCAADAPLSEAHAAAQRVHDKIEREFPEVKHCMVHMNPK